MQNTESMRRPLSSLAVLALAAAGLAQSVDPSFYQDLQWRCIGPFRGGRTVGACGVVQQPNVFYVGVNNGGVWKTNDYGMTWKPIFDDQSTGSIGDVAVAPSDPNIVYVGSGEGIQRPDLSVGNGMYKSTDAGKTWSHIGLDDAQQIGGLAVNPTDPNLVYAAVLGHPYGPNPMRGVFRSSNGGKTWDKILYRNQTTGAFQVTIDPKNPHIVFADLWEGQQGPWENAYLNGTNNGLFKSTDNGNTWHQMLGGLPAQAEGLGRIGFCIAPSNDQIMYATVQANKNGGIYRSDDGGANWHMVANQDRLWGRGDDFAEIKVDPLNPDIVYDANTCTYKSTDGGKTWAGWKGAPGGDDYHRIWINPTNPQIILLGVDQGATLSVNGGETWSSWYNQPTAQLYHVAADNAFPYRLYSGQQESGSVGIASRGNDGAISFREWHPVAAEEYGYCAPDPLDPNVVFGGKISRFDWRTAQGQDVSPQGDFRFLRTAPIIFSPADPHTLFYAGNKVFKTRNGGNSWDVISPDLSREHPELPASVGVYKTPELEKMARRGVVYALGPSRFDVNLLWAGTDDGLIWVTRDGGKKWSDVTPSDVSSWSKISQIDAGHFDKETAYVAVNRIRVDDMKPHIYKTHDGGKTWTQIVNGLPDAPINVVREDPLRPGLLYSGSETSVWFSVDDGATWNPLRMNMPATSIRDLIVKDDDLCVGTHGRSFWILDDITPLRQIGSAHASEQGHNGMGATSTVAVPMLFKPELATRVRWNMNPDTPLPPEEPVGKNPPDGAILNYYLGADVKGPVALEILDSTGHLVRRYSSDDKPLTVNIDEQSIPAYWIRPPQILSATPGMHRFYWDLHYGPAPTPQGIPMQAIVHDTPSEPKGPWAMPGKYTVRLVVNGNAVEQPLTLRMDPRVTASMQDLQMQFDIGKGGLDAAARAGAIQNEIAAVRDQIKTARAKATGDEAKRLDALDTKLADLVGQGGGGRRRSRFGGGLADSFGGVSGSVEGADVRPTITMQNAYKGLVKQLADLEAAWSAIETKELNGFTVPFVAPAAPFYDAENGDIG
jgi:photosystem II stability/assembly factor-like uncharacterized protein